jgi:hypothetical protein
VRAGARAHLLLGQLKEDVLKVALILGQVAEPDSEALDGAASTH